MYAPTSSLRRRVAIGLTIGLTALAIVVSPAAAPSAALADGGQSDPAWDYGRGGAEAPGIPACYMPAGSETMRKEYNVYRPSCFTGKLQ
jgi:hypothetical protein